jgi:hypothetical protein
MHSNWARRRTSFFVGLAVPLFLSVTVHASSEHDDDNLREDVISCEEAVGKLEECCHETFALTCNFLYDHQEGSCDDDSSSTTSYKPDLDLSESSCVRAHSCAEIVTAGQCARAAQVRPGRNDSSSSYSGSFDYGSNRNSTSVAPDLGPRVCP